MFVWTDTRVHCPPHFLKTPKNKNDPHSTLSSSRSMCTGSHTGLILYAHTHTHILLSWSDDIINNHYWDTRKCRDLRLSVWLHGIRLACCRWEIWKEKHPAKLFYLQISLVPWCQQWPRGNNGKIQEGPAQRNFVGLLSAWISYKCVVIFPLKTFKWTFCENQKYARSCLFQHVGKPCQMAAWSNIKAYLQCYTNI